MFASHILKRVSFAINKLSMSQSILVISPFAPSEQATTVMLREAWS